ncbi:hypothetical protein ACTXT7_003885 [Hymenolepis weldensis]
MEEIKQIVWNEPHYNANLSVDEQELIPVDNDPKDKQINFGISHVIAILFYLNVANRHSPTNSSNFFLQ